jgi:hypothetical protein
MHFSTFAHVVKLVLLITFCFGAFLKLFNKFKISMKFFVFYTFFMFSKHFVMSNLLLVLFSNFEAKRAENGAKNLKTY